MSELQWILASPVLVILLYVGYTVLSQYVWPLYVYNRSKLVVLATKKLEVHYIGLSKPTVFDWTIIAKGFNWVPACIGDTIILRTYGATITDRFCLDTPYDLEFVLTYNGKWSNSLYSVSQKITGRGDHVEPESGYLYYHTSKLYDPSSLKIDFMRYLRRTMVYGAVICSMVGSVYATPFKLTPAGCENYVERVEALINRFHLGLPMVVSLPKENAMQDHIDAYKRVKYDLPSIVQKLVDGTDPLLIISTQGKLCMAQHGN